MKPTGLTVLALCAAPALADLTLLTDNRFYEINVGLDGPTGSDAYYNRVYATDSVSPFDHWSTFEDYSVPGGYSGEGNAFVLVDSQITPTLIRSSIEVRSIAQSDDALTLYAEATSRVVTQIGFSLSEVSDWRIIAPTYYTGVGELEVSLREGLSPGGSTVFFHTENSFEGIFTLGPGDYTLTMSAEASAVVRMGNASATGSAYFEASFQQVPAPSSLALLALGGLAARRRRI